MIFIINMSIRNDVKITLENEVDKNWVVIITRI